MLLYHDCYDNLKKIKTPNPRWGSPRDNSTTTTAVNTRTVFTITAAAGIDTLSQSRDYTHAGSTRHFQMDVVSDGGAIDISASPQIVAGLQGDLLTLNGTSDTNTITFDDNGTLALWNDYPMILTDGDTITFVYNATLSPTVGGWGGSQWGQTGFGWGGASSGWVETSRNKGGI